MYIVQIQNKSIRCYFAFYKKWLTSFEDQIHTLTYKNIVENNSISIFYHSLNFLLKLCKRIKKYNINKKISLLINKTIIITHQTNISVKLQNINLYNVKNFIYKQNVLLKTLIIDLHKTKTLNNINQNILSELIPYLKIIIYMIRNIIKHNTQTQSNNYFIIIGESFNKILQQFIILHLGSQI